MKYSEVAIKTKGWRRSRFEKIIGVFCQKGYKNKSSSVLFKINNNFAQSLWGACLITLASCLFFGSNAIAITAYTAEDMGNLGGTTSYPVAINSYGEVVGYSNTTSAGLQHAMAWSNNGSNMEDLGTLGGPWSEAYGINDVGQVVGKAYLSNGTTNRATLWSKKNGAWSSTDLGTYSGYNSSTAYGINNYGQVVGDSVINIANTGTFAMIWNPGEPIKNLGGLGGSRSVAYGINDAGQVVGYAYLSGDIYANAVLWNSNSGVWTKTNLGTLSGSYNTISVAYGINASGQIVGYSYLSSSKNAPYHATLWSNNAGNWTPTDMQTLGGTNSWARGINAYGQIVGYSETLTGDYHATLWDNGIIQDINDLVTINGGSYLYTASGINDAGQIVAQGANGHAYLLTPSVPPATVPGKPIIGTATRRNASAKVTFSAPTSNGGSAIISYIVISNPGGKTATGAKSPITVTGLTNGTAYTFTVKATNAVGTGAASAPSNRVRPRP